MDEEQLFLFEEDPLPEEISQDPAACPFCGGNPHLNRKILRARMVMEKTPWTKDAAILMRHERISVYVYCGRCRARGPIVTRTPKRRSEEDEMKVEAIRKWNSGIAFAACR